MPFVTEEWYGEVGQLVEDCGFRMSMMKLALARRDSELLTSRALNAVSKNAVSKNVGVSKPQVNTTVPTVPGREPERWVSPISRPVVLPKTPVKSTVVLPKTSRRGLGRGSSRGSRRGSSRGSRRGLGRGSSLVFHKGKTTNGVKGVKIEKWFDRRMVLGN